MKLFLGLASIALTVCLAACATAGAGAPGAPSAASAGVGLAELASGAPRGGNILVHNGYGLSLPPKYSFKLYFTPSPSYFIADSEHAFDEDLMILGDGAPGVLGLLENLRSERAPKPEEIKEYYKKFFLDCDSVEAEQVSHPAGSPAYIYRGQPKGKTQTRHALVIPPAAGRKGVVIQVNDGWESAREIFSGFEFKPERESRREVPGGPGFRCTDGAWAWVGDIPGGAVFRHSAKDRHLIAALGPPGEIESREKLVSLKDSVRGAFKLEALIDSRPRELEAFLLAPRDKNSDEKQRGILMALPPANKPLSMLVFASTPPAFSSEGRLDEPAVEALLSTYLSFEPAAVLP